MCSKSHENGIPVVRAEPAREDVTGNLFTTPQSQPQSSLDFDHANGIPVVSTEPVTPQSSQGSQRKRSRIPMAIKKTVKVLTKSTKSKIPVPIKKQNVVLQRKATKSKIPVPIKKRETQQTTGISGRARRVIKRGVKVNKKAKPRWRESPTPVKIESSFTLRLFVLLNMFSTKNKQKKH